LLAKTLDVADVTLTCLYWMDDDLKSALSVPQENGLGDHVQAHDRDDELHLPATASGMDYEVSISLGPCGRIAEKGNDLGP
jgi:hypothetical protein